MANIAGSHNFELSVLSENSLQQYSINPSFLDFEDVADYDPDESNGRVKRALMYSLNTEDGANADAPTMDNIRGTIGTSDGFKCFKEESTNESGEAVVIIRTVGDRPSTVRVKFLDIDRTPEAKARFETHLKTFIDFNDKRFNLFQRFHVDYATGQAHIISDWESHDLLRYLRDHRPDNEKVFGMIQEIAECLRFLHDSGVVHGNLKAGNVLVKLSGEIVLCDFGLHGFVKPRVRDDGSAPPQISVRWCSPEVLNGQPRTFASDVWAWGMIIFAIAEDQIPFRSEDEDENLIRNSILQGNLPSLTRIRQIHPVLQQIVKKCWKTDPTARPTITRCIDDLKEADLTTLKLKLTEQQRAWITAFQITTYLLVFVAAYCGFWLPIVYGTGYHPIKSAVGYGFLIAVPYFLILGTTIKAWGYIFSPKGVGHGAKVVKKLFPGEPERKVTVVESDSDSE